MKIISIIVPCYNVEKYIDRCMGSLVNQTIGIDNLEIILVNDGSTDHTLDVAATWQQQYPDTIKLINFEHNCGQGIARNKALQTVTTPYLGFADADDWCEPEMYELLLSAITAHNCDLALCHCVRDDGTITSLNKPRAGQIIILDSIQKRSDSIAYHTIGEGIWCSLNRTDWLKKNNIQFIEGKKYEDFLWITQVHLYANRACVLEDELYHYFINLNSTVLSGGLETHKDSFESAIITYEYCKNLPEYHQYKDAIDLNFIRFFYFQGLKLLANRIEHPSVTIFEWMRDTINILIPDWRDNSYVKTGLNEFYRYLLQLMDMNITSEDFKQCLRIIRETGI